MRAPVGEETKMQKSEIHVEEEYVLREGKGSDAPLQFVKIIHHVGSGTLVQRQL